MKYILLLSIFLCLSGCASVHKNIYIPSPVTQQAPVIIQVPSVPRVIKQSSAAEQHKCSQITVSSAIKFLLTRFFMFVVVPFVVGVVVGVVVKDKVMAVYQKVKDKLYPPQA